MIRPTYLWTKNVVIECGIEMGAYSIQFLLDIQFPCVGRHDSREAHVASNAQSYVGWSRVDELRGECIGAVFPTEGGHHQ